MREQATRLAPWISIAAAVIGVFMTWTSEGAVDLDGLEGPNNGWLVLIVAGLAVVWARSAARGSWVGVVGVLGASAVMCWTALENWRDGRDVGAAASFGLLLVVAASIVLAGMAAARGLAMLLDSPSRERF